MAELAELGIVAGVATVDGVGFAAVSGPHPGEERGEQSAALRFGALNAVLAALEEPVADAPASATVTSVRRTAC